MSHDFSTPFEDMVGDIYRYKIDKDSPKIPVPIYSTDPPPNYALLRKHFPKADFDRGIVYVYGNVIHSKFELPWHLQVHELVHIAQQKQCGSPEIWWQRYIEDPKWRLEQEIEAMREEYSFIKRHYQPHEHFGFLRYLAQALVSYYDVNIGYFRAVELIRDTTKPIHI